MIGALLNSSSPLIFAGLGALLTELTGVLGVFIDGFMSLGAFFSFVIAGWTNSIFLGTLITAIIIGSMGFLLSIFVQKSGANPFIAGLALNLAAGGICNSLSMIFFNTQGVIRNPNLNIPASIAIPLIKDIPLLGNLISGHLPFVYLSIAVLAVCFFVINKTRAGLHLRASGLSINAAIERGINPHKYRAWAWFFAAALASLGGADLTFRIGVYTPGAIAGRGWIALAAVYLGFKNVWGIAIAALLFALVERMGISLQGTGIISGTIVQGIPSLLACILFSITQILAARKKERKSSNVRE
jgi:simple sugar transport system permease protein